MMSKPEHLSKQYGDQFADKSIVEHYHHRPAYSDEVIAHLSGCLGFSPLKVLDIGCGTGEISIPLAKMGHSVVGLDPSAQMIKKARSKLTTVKFVESYIEQYHNTEVFDLIVAANSIHWADWPKAFAVLKGLSNSKSRFAVVTGGDLVISDAQADIFNLITRYSTNTDFKPYSVVDMLVEQQYLQPPVIKNFPAKTIQQSTDDFIASFHARNGFSLDRMDPRSAVEFDAQLKQLLKHHGYDRVVQGQVTYSVALGIIV